MTGAPVHILGWDDKRQVWLAYRDGELSFVWVNGFADAYLAAHASRDVDLIVPAAIYQDWIAAGDAPEIPPPGVQLVDHPMMVVDVDKLTDLLADRMAAIVPDGFHVEAADGIIWYSADERRLPGRPASGHMGISWTYVRASFRAHGQTDEEHMTGVATQALGELQDYVEQATQKPWPGDQTAAQPHAAVRDGTLHIWYGEPDPSGQVFLACQPIPLSDLEHSS